MEKSKRKNIIKIFFIVIGAILVIWFFIINIQNDKKYLDENYLDKVELEENIYLEDIKIEPDKVESIFLSISWAYHYGYLQELIEESDFIFIGHIKSWDSFVDDFFVMTNYEFYIDELIDGDMPEDVLTILDCGGIIPYEEFYPNSEDAIHKEWISFASVLPYDLLPLDKDFIIFCKKVIDKGEVIYIPVGNFQGVFMSEQGGEVFERMMTEDINDNIGEITKEEVLEVINE